MIKDEEVVADLKVESVSAINETSVTVTFAEGVEVTEESLSGKVITLTAGETVLTATYAAGSKGTNTAVFALDGDSVLADATVYTLSAEGLTFTDASFTAEIGSAYAKVFTAVTEKVTAKDTSTGSTDTGERKIAFSAKDQYGKDFDLTGTTLSLAGSTLNGMPLVESTEISVTNDVLTITSAVTLKENDKLVIKLTNKDGDKVLSEGTLEYTVAKAEAAVPTSIDSLKAVITGKEGTSVVAGDTVTLTADVRDQNNTPMTGQNVRFVVTAGKDLLANIGDGLTLGKDKATLDVVNQTGVVFKVESPGTVTIDAYNTANGAKKTYTVTVGAKELTTIVAPTFAANLYNNEEIKSTNAITANPGAALTPEMIKFNVVDDKGNATTDVSVKAQLRGGSDKSKENDIIVVAKSTKVGTYKITPYVGTSFDDVKAVKATAVTVKTTLNPIATTIDAITVPTLKVGTPVTKEIVVRNKHNEDITSIVKDNISFKTYKAGAIDNSSITSSAVALNETTKNYEVKLTANAEGQYTVRGTVTDTAAIVNIDVTAEATKLASIDLGKDIFDGVISGDDATYHIITAKDNKTDIILPVIDGNGVGTNPKAWTVTAKVGTVVKNDNGGTVVYVKKDSKGKWETTNLASAEAIALKIDTKNGSDINNLSADTTVAYTVTNGETDADKKIEDSINVKVKAIRTISTITTEPVAVQAGMGATATLKVIPKDQYGKVVSGLTVDKFTIVSSDDAIVNDETVTGWTEKGVDSEKAINADTNPTAYYEFTVDTVANGSAQLTISKAGATTIKSVVNVTVDTAANLVKSLEIKGKDIKDGAYKYKLNDDITDLVLSVDAKDANGNPVAITEGDVVWTSSHPAIVVATDGTVAVDVDKITSLTDENEEVTVTADVFDVVQTIKLTVSSEASAVQPGTFALEKAGDVTDLSKVDGDVDTAGIQVYLDGDAKDGELAGGTIVLTYTAKDQFGKTPDDLAGQVQIYTPGIIAPVTTLTSNTLTITPEKIGTTKVKVKLSDNQEVVVDVVVTKDNKIIKDKATAAQAAADLQTAKTTVEGLTYTELEVSELTDAAKKAAVEAVVNAATLPTGVTAEVSTNGSTVTLKKTGAENVVVTISATFKLTEKAQALSNLNSKIDAATQAHTSATEGEVVGNYITGSKTTLQSAITVAAGVKNDAANKTAQELTSAMNTLDDVLTAFNNSKVVELTGLSDVSITGTASDEYNTVTLEAGESLEVSSSNALLAEVEVKETNKVNVTGVADGTPTITVKVKKDGKTIKVGTFTATVSGN